jgi:hypothetical protein
VPKKPRPPDRADLVREPTAEYRVTRRISATEAARNLSDLLNRVHYRHEAFVIERAGVPVGELRPVSAGAVTGADLRALLQALPPVDAGFFDDVEAASRSQPGLPDSPWER